MIDVPHHRTSPSTLTVAFVALMIAWLASALSMLRAQWIVNGMRADDIGDSFRLAHYIVERMLPFDCIVVVFHLICMAALIWASATGTTGLRGLILSVICVVSFVVHGFVFALHLALIGY